MGRHLGIDFCWIPVDFWSKQGKKIEAKAFKKGFEKKDRKQKGTKNARKSFTEAITSS